MNRISEVNISRLWKRGRLPRLRDDMGHEVEIICSGRASTKPGCDFQDAVIAFDGERLVGDIELHVSSDLWQKHRHHINPAYNGVILHVAMWQCGKLPVKLESGRYVPTVILSDYVTGQSLRKGRVGRPAGHCRYAGSKRNARRLNCILSNAGMQRLSAKCARYAVALQEGEEEQVVYKGICRALGYSRNSLPFMSLAERLPLRMVRQVAWGSLVKKQALILGTAGMLSDRCHPGMGWLSVAEAAEIEKQWSELSVRPEPLPMTEWSFSYLRPASHPLKRLLYLCYLLQKYEDEGLVSSLIGTVEKQPIGCEGAWLEQALMMTGDQPLIGAGRAREIVLNQLLPFMLAHHVKAGNFTMAVRMINAYLKYKSLPDNELLRYMRQQLRLSGTGDLNACQQQGMLHIYYSFCREKNCPDCPVFRCQKPDRG